MNAIELKNLKKTYRGKTKAVDGISLDVPKSVIFGILGPNGAGKSTIMNILAGLVNKSEGEVRILGKTIKKGDYEYKRDVGFVLDRPHYIEKLSVKEYLHFAGAMYELEPDEIDSRSGELIRFFGLEEKENDWIESYSTGMKKKVELAAALIHRPKLLILDEPLEGIDPISAKQIKDNLRLMVERGISILLSSHNLDTVEKLCGEVAIINKGKLVYRTKTEEIRKQLKNDLTGGTRRSLEEIFMDVVSEGDDRTESMKLSWLKSRR